MRDAVLPPPPPLPRPAACRLLDLNPAFSCLLPQGCRQPGAAAALQRLLQPCGQVRPGGLKGRGCGRAAARVLSAARPPAPPPCPPAPPPCPPAPPPCPPGPPPCPPAPPPCSFGDPPATIQLESGHRGVQLLGAALGGGSARLGPGTLPDLLQAAAFLQARAIAGRRVQGGAGTQPACATARLPFQAHASPHK